MIVFPAKSIFEEIDSIPQSLQVSEAVLVTIQIPKQRKRILNLSESMPETEISSFIAVIISENVEKQNNRIIVPEISVTEKANSGLYCFNIIMAAADMIPIPDIKKISFIGQKQISPYQRDCLFR